MKKTLIVIALVLIFTVVIFYFVYSRKPKVSAENIDFINKTVNYKMSAGGFKFEGVKRFTDKTTTEQTNGNYRFVASAEGNSFVLAIYESKSNGTARVNTLLKGIKIDLLTRLTTDLSGSVPG